MSFTPEGMERVWEILTGQSKDSLAGGSIRVSGESETATVSIENISISRVESHVRLSVSATFDEMAANHDWSRREVLTKEGVILDIEDSDGGRKVPGTVWNIEVGLDLVPQNVD